LSAAQQFPILWPVQSGSNALQPRLLASAVHQMAVHHIQKRLPQPELVVEAEQEELESEAELGSESESEQEPEVCWAFYRKHTENLLRRYLYASMQVGRSPDLLKESVGRGWVSSRRVKTFEDSLIFVLDVERCLGRLSALDRQLITRRVIQEYSAAQTAAMMGLGARTACSRLAAALGRLTESLVEAGLLMLPD